MHLRFTVATIGAEEFHAGLRVLMGAMLERVCLGLEIEHLQLDAFPKESVFCE